MSTQILIGAERHVSEIMLSALPRGRCFHNMKHTQSVALKCYEMATFYNIPAEKRLTLYVAAWFHDVGYCINSVNHEMHSVQLMKNYLTDLLTKEQISEVERIIYSTRLAMAPACHLEQIICDADTSHLGAKQYEQWSTLLRRELEHYNSHRFSNEEWDRQNLTFFERHQYFTGYANLFWGPQKQRNLAAITRRVHQPVC